MTTTTVSATRTPALDALWVRAGIAILGALVANLLLLAIAVPLLDLPGGFLPTTPGAVALFTLVGSVAALVVWLLVRRFAKAPVRTYRIVAVAALVLSLIPDVGLLVDPGTFVDVTVRGVVTLMLMHVAGAAVIVPALTWRRA